MNFGIELRLTNLEFRLLHLQMSRPGFVFSLEEIIESTWGGYGNGDEVLLKNVVDRLRKKIEENRAVRFSCGPDKEAKADAFLTNSPLTSVIFGSYTANSINYIGPIRNCSNLTSAQRNLAVSIKDALDKYNNLDCP